MSIAQASAAPAWRTPALILLAGAAISFIGFGPRSVFGFFLQPISNEFGWGRNVFALSFALQQLFWGIGQPFAGAIADRFGASRVLIGGALLYLAGLLLMTVSSEPALMHITAGVMIGFALAGCSFNVVLGAFAKLLPPEKRGLGLGLGTAAGSFGQFVCSPFAPMLVDALGWKGTLYVLAAATLIIVPLAYVLWTAPAEPGKFSARSPGPLVADGCAEGSARASVLCAAGSWLLHLRLPARLHHGSPAAVSRRPRPRSVGRRHHARRDRTDEHRRLAGVGLDDEPLSAALHARHHLCAAIRSSSSPSCWRR